MGKIRLRFAPSPTGALHIGGLRTALYNYLLAKRHEGTFILRIEDTDQTRYVDGAEKYIMDALKWCGIVPDESPVLGGEHGPYRQSERKAIYRPYAERLVREGKAYYAFDTPEEWAAKRNELQEAGNHSPKYDASVRGQMKTSLAMSENELEAKLNTGSPHVIRLMVPENEEVLVEDRIRGQVRFETNVLDDKVLLKTDGMPTYHLANIVDDHLMEISHVIRGEEWLSSTAHHILLYQAFGWEPPVFAHLPLILKPSGKGKLSKRDGKKLGIPVFPLSWMGETEEDSFTGFKEYGFLPEAAINFLALLGWNSGTDQEIFDMQELVKVFALDQVGKSGARFDFEKAKWFNQQYLINLSSKEVARQLQTIIPEGVTYADAEFLEKVVDLMKERVHFLPEFFTEGDFFFTDPIEFEEKVVRKKFDQSSSHHFESIIELISDLADFNAVDLESEVKSYIQSQELSFGKILPALRIAITGGLKGPDLFHAMSLLGQRTVVNRIEFFLRKHNA